MNDKNLPKVLFLSPVSHFKGGAEKCLMEFVDNPFIASEIAAPADGPIFEAAKKDNIPTHIVSFGDVETVRRPFSFMKGIGVIRSLLEAAIILKKTAKDNDIYIVHSNGLKAHAINCVSRVIGGPKAIVHIHDIPLTRQEKLFWKILYFMCDKMLIVSRPCWPGGKLPPKCQVVHNGTVLGKEVKIKSLENGNEVIVGFAGRIHPAKGLHLLLRWVAYARKQGIKARISVRGSFSEDAPAYQGEIAALIKDLCLTDSVDLLGHIDNPNKVYEGLDVVVVPSQIPDPLPRSVMEPMAQGIPVFGYPAGGIPEMIEHGKSGFLVKNEEEFAQSLEKLANNYDQIVKGASEKIQREFAIERLYDDLSNVYNDLK